MNYRSRSVQFRRLAGLGVITALLVTAFAPVMSASQEPATNSPSFSTRSIAKVVATSSPAPVRMNRTAAEAAKTTKTQPGNSGPFFKTRTGLVVLAVMAVGTGYALYSAKEDRIHGSNR